MKRQKKTENIGLGSTAMPTMDRKLKQNVDERPKKKLTR